ncbi:receptor-like protein EIX1 [Tasmannia lanceolata]|uniref:receptor-like protein EIX1 n=1 Tax=Tasmannia lanceolata TaxID=3420 RepID=UPI0040635601
MEIHRSSLPSLVVFGILFIKFNLYHGGSVMGCVETEKQALIEFKNGLKDPMNRLSSWVDGNCCNWSGVYCNEKMHVIELYLRNPYYNNKGFLSGKLSSSLINLQYLTYLDLSLNDFGGTNVPEFIGSMKSLRYLNLDRSGFIGTIPWQLGNLSNLNFLNLQSILSPEGKPVLKVDSLKWLSHLSSLEHLNLGFIDLSQAGDTWVEVINMLPSLSNLSLVNCSLNRIPSSLPSFNLTSLVYLDISINNFSSPIPNWLFNATGLGYLGLHDNHFHGYLPEGIGHLRNLSFLDLSINLLRGSIPLSVGNLSYLQILYLYQNQFDGLLPSSLGQLSRLVEINIASNFFHGDLSEIHLSNLRRLKKLNTYKNYFTLKVESDWNPPFQLDSLSLASTILGPSFPAWLRHQKRLKYLDLGNTSISDTIPGWFAEITPGLHRLKLPLNRIYGQLPKSLRFRYRAMVDLSSNLLEGLFPFPSLNNFRLLDLSNNLFSGPIPNSIGKQTLLQVLSLSDNRFNGCIPVSMGKLQHLKLLDLARNQLVGNIPESLGNCCHMEALYLESNYLSGEIPKSIGRLTRPTSIHLNNNSLSGEFPPLLHCANLMLLDLGENKLSGNIPTWVGERLSSLLILRLRSNEFNGTIPPQLAYLPSLQVLDLANNCLSGPIPPSFCNFTAMVEVQKTDRDLGHHLDVGGELAYYEETLLMIMKGMPLLYCGSTLALVTAMDISGNNLSGEIPNSLTKLSGLLLLNLSGNHFTGIIPEDIGNLGMLESLDVSNNHLSGEIPLSITALNFLTALNLSNNNLSGKIPSGNQLQTLTDLSIYSGNPLLCGYPLPISCPGKKIVDHGVIEGDTQNIWIATSFCFGFLCGILVLCIIFLVKKSWGDACLCLLDEIMDKIDGIGKCRN